MGSKKEEIAKAFEKRISNEAINFTLETRLSDSAFIQGADWVKEEFIEMYLALDEYLKDPRNPNVNTLDIALKAWKKADKKIGVGGDV